MQRRPGLQLLGAPRLAVQAAAAVAPVPAKAFVLMALLLIKFSGSAPRSVLTELLWEDAPAETGLANMRQLLARVRANEAATGLALLNASRQSIEIATAGAACDLTSVLAPGTPKSARELETALDLYRGPLLDGVTGLGLELTRWVDSEREKLQAKFATSITQATATIGGTAALEGLRRLSGIARYDDKVCQRLMQAYAETGATQSVVRTYQDFRTRLGEELQRQPSGETEELFLRLTRRTTETAPLAAVTVRRSRSSVPDVMPSGAEVQTLRSMAAIPRLAILMPTRLPTGGNTTAFVPLVSALMEDVTIGLCRLRSLAIIAPHSARQFTRKTLVETAKAFSIDYVLETQVSEDPTTAGAARLSVKLIHVPSWQIPWAEKYSLELGSEQERYRDLTNWIVRTLADAVEQAELVKYSAMRDPGAYGLYLGGRQLLRVLDLPNLRRARKMFASAIDQAPQFSLPYSGIARSLVFEWVLRAQGNRELLEEARRLAQKAVALDPFDGDGHRELGRTALYLGDLDGSLRGFERAEHYAPHHADLLADYADTLIHNSDPATAKDRIDAALDLNPLAPDEYLWTAGGVNFFLHHYEEALSRLKRMKNTDPALKLMAACAIRLGDKSAAQQYRDQALALNPDFEVDVWINKLPQRNPQHRQDYADALKAAGFH